MVMPSLLSKLTPIPKLHLTVSLLGDLRQEQNTTIEQFLKLLRNQLVLKEKLQPVAVPPVRQRFLVIMMTRAAELVPVMGAVPRLPRRASSHYSMG